jgi:pSer/pThr/pTyr-binding forkhead associated (FHA) protein
MDDEKTVHFGVNGAPLGEAVPTLKLLSGPLEGREYRLVGSEYLIGRDHMSDIVIDLKDVSRRHAKIEKSATEYVVCDLGSANGVFVNNLKLPRAVLMNGDVIQIGSCLLQFCWNRPLSPP